MVQKTTRMSSPIPQRTHATTRTRQPARPDVATDAQRHTPDVQVSHRTTTDALPSLRRRGPLFSSRRYILVGMLLILILYWVGSTLVIPFVSEQLDQWHYGTARLAQYDLNVGHGGTSHFLTEFWHGKVLVIEFPGDNPAHAHVYLLTVSGIEATRPRVITLHTAYVNPHGRPGKPDLVVQVEGLTVSPILYNSGDAFQTSIPV